MYPNLITNKKSRPNKSINPISKDSKDKGMFYQHGNINKALESGHVTNESRVREESTLL